VRNVNIVHVSNVTVINNVNVANVRYMNQNVAGAVTVVPHDAFAAGRPVAVAAVAVRPGMMAEAHVMETAGVAPTRESVLGHAGPMVAHAPPSRFVERTVVARNTPPPPPVSFAAQEQALRANGGRPLEPAAVNNLRAGQPVHPMVRTVGGGGPSGPGVGSRPGGPGPEANRPLRNDRPPTAQRPGGQPAYERPGQQPAVQQHEPANAATPAAHTPETPHPATQTESGKGSERTSSRPAAKGQPKKETKKAERQ
jgi:hypothetical protein